MPAPTARLRILATSDLHMQITAFDYAKDRPSKGGSLARLATLIARARAEAADMGAACLLLDNGDTLQGTPLAEIAARRDDTRPHPMVSCMNHLRYDAGGLGNHDFDHGLDALARCLARQRMPVICSNLSAEALPMVKRHHVLDCMVGAENGPRHPLRVGVVSSLPDRTALWNRHQVEGRALFEAPLAAIEREAAALRAEGADVIVVLAHMGLALFDEGEAAQNRIADVTALSDVDVVIGGHTHLRFPGEDHRSVEAADCLAGTVHGKPVVMPGASASDLGEIDLLLDRCADGGWRLRGNMVRLRPATLDTPEDPEIVRLVAREHEDTRRFLSRPVGRLKRPMNSFFALAHPSPVPALMAAAKRRAIERIVAGSPYADLPLLSVASAPLTGGFDGPDNFLNLCGDHVHLYHVAGMDPYANHVWAVRTNGAQLIDWLERSALIYNTLRQDMPEQLLVDPAVPGFRYDAIYGLTYRIDPRLPPAFDPSGRRIEGRAGRVSEIRFQGVPLRDDQEFLVATTDHRAGGGGVYKTFSTPDIVVQGDVPLQQSLVEFLKDGERQHSDAAAPWAFVPGMDRSAILLTAPEALGHLDEIAHLRPEACGETADGFLRVRIHL